MVRLDLKIEIPAEMDPKELEKFERDIKLFVKLRMARDLLLREWNKRFSKSKLSEGECIELGREVNKTSFKVWKEKGWL